MAGRIVLREARESDCRALHADLRPGDRAEVEALRGYVHANDLRLAILASDMRLAMEVDGALALVCGVVPVSLVNGSGNIWMLGTTHARGTGRSLGLIARRYLAEASQAYPRLFNWVDARNAPSLRLIRWLGFEVEPALPFGALGLPFHRFELRSDQQLCASRREPLA